MGEEDKRNMAESICLKYREKVRDLQDNCMKEMHDTKMKSGEQQSWDGLYCKERGAVAQ